MKLRNSILALVVLGVLGFAGYAALFTSTPAPGVTFTSLKGERVSTADLRGHVVLVNFWATDCPTCVKEMPRMVTTYNKYQKQGLEFVAV
ncbi:MAG TPA: redoxin family protein, partial [Burkholderiales bacterium]|nr:redoxin family protein [Burkholderiales bacterium]